MKAILIKRALTPEETTSVRDMAGSGEHMILPSPYTPQGIDVAPSPSGITEEEKRKINYDTMDQLIAFGDKVIEGKSVIEWLAFDDSSIWYYHKFRAYFRLRNLRYELAEIKELSGSYDELLVYHNDAMLAKVNLPDNVSLIKGTARKNKENKCWNMIAFATILLSRYFLNIFSFGKLRKPVHIIMDVSKRQSILDIKSLQLKKGNYLIGYLLDQAGEDFLILDEAVQPKLSGNKILLSNDNLFGKGKLQRRFFGEPVLLKYYLSSSLRERKKKLVKEINNGIEKIYDKSDADGKLLMDIYRSFGEGTGFYIMKYLAYKKFFSKHSYKSISTTDENSPTQRSILDAARISGIKSIGIQHGNIHDLHPAYRYSHTDANNNAIPDYTIAWGDSWKDFLVDKGNYPADSVQVCGVLRTDIIPRLQGKKFNKNEVVQAAGKEDNLIVFASQPQRDEQLRKRAALEVMQGTKDIPGAYLVVKLHPNEKNDFGYYSQIAKEAGLNRFMITLDIDLFLLISVCDILITCFSTVGTETVFFNKPLIILDHLKQDIQHYHSEGVAFQATNEEELKAHIINILEGKTDINKESYNNYIKKYANTIDGKVSERIVSFIRSV